MKLRVNRVNRIYLFTTVYESKIQWGSIKSREKKERNEILLMKIIIIIKRTSLKTSKTKQQRNIEEPNLRCK